MSSIIFNQKSPRALGLVQRAAITQIREQYSLSAQVRIDFGDRQQTLHAREVYAAFADKVLDYLQAIELIAGIQAHAADRPAWLDKAKPLVFPQRLWMHPEHPGGHADKKKILIQGCADPSIAIDTTRVNVGEGQYCQCFRLQIS